MSLFRPHSPKLGVDSSTGRANWYPYYAGYSPTFVADMIAHLKLLDRDEAVVLDPWNGSGTTTTVCSQRGILSAGFDLNPAMVVVARARLLDSTIADSLSPLLEVLLRSAKDLVSSGAPEPLCSWFTKGTAMRLRALDSAIRKLLVSQAASLDVSKFSSLASFFYVLLFRLARKAIKSGSVSNPTWTRETFEQERLVRLTWRQIEAALRVDLGSIQLVDPSKGSRRQAASHLATADSRSIPLPDHSVDAVISSPPYCTRIDYAVATRVELAVLGLGEDSVDALRRDMLGTTVAAKHLEVPDLPPIVASLVERIAAHPSKASGTYYRRTTEDYFHKLNRSLAEISRVVKPEGSLVLVVQDSYYKNIHIDLAACTSSILSEFGFSLKRQWDFQPARSMRRIKAGFKATALPIESALLLTRVMK